MAKWILFGTWAVITIALTTLLNVSLTFMSFFFVYGNFARFVRATVVNFKKKMRCGFGFISLSLISNGNHVWIKLLKQWKISKDVNDSTYRVHISISNATKHNGWNAHSQWQNDCLVFVALPIMLLPPLMMLLEPRPRRLHGKLFCSLLYIFRLILHLKHESAVFFIYLRSPPQLQ